MYIVAELPDEDEQHSTITSLTALMLEVLVNADHLCLPPPHYVTVSGTRNLSLQLPPVMGSIDAVRRWASAHCAAMRSDTRDGDNGPAIWVSTEFDFDGVDVNVYAHIPVPETEPVISTQYGSELPF